MLLAELEHTTPERPHGRRVIDLRSDVPFLVVVMNTHPRCSLRKACIFRRIPLRCVSYSCFVLEESHLYRSPGVIPRCLSHIPDHIRDIRILLPGGPSSMLPLPLQILNGFNILVLLLSPVARHVAGSHLLALVNEQCTAKSTMEHAEEFSGFGAVFWVV